VKEIFKKIAGFEDYSVSNFGTVKRDIDSSNHKRAGQVLKHIVDKAGYHWVSLSKSKVKKRCAVHRLVLTTFVGGRPSQSHQCNHKDCNKSNNHPSNLEWVTPRENTVHAVKNGLKKGVRGECNNLSKLKAGEVWLIRKILSSNAMVNRKQKTGFLTTKQLAEMFSIHERTIFRIASNSVWNGVSG